MIRYNSNIYHISIPILLWVRLYLNLEIVEYKSHLLNLGILSGMICTGWVLEIRKNIIGVGSNSTTKTT